MEGLLILGAAGALGVAAVLWGADSRDGFSTDPRSFGHHWLTGDGADACLRAGGRGAHTLDGRFLGMIDHLAAQVHVRTRQEAFLREAAYDRLCRQATRSAGGASGAGATVPVAAFARRTVAWTGAVLVALGTRLQQLANPRDAAPDLKPAAC